jgi:ABC-type multidrug transport system permease subunit
VRRRILFASLLYTWLSVSFDQGRLPILDDTDYGDLYQLDPFTRLIGGMVVTELHDLPVVCTSGEYNSFPAPAGQTCGEYMKDFFASGRAGYLLENATDTCRYCAYKV